MGSGLQLPRLAQPETTDPPETTAEGLGLEMAEPIKVTHESEPLPHKTIRAKVKQLLRKLVEPEPRYNTGKQWND